MSILHQMTYMDSVAETKLVEPLTGHSPDGRSWIDLPEIRVIGGGVTDTDG